jgi:TonB family protein
VPSPEPPPVTPPRLESEPLVAYPDGALGDAEVILLLVIEADGRVRSATVERGDEPFASAARAAAEGFRFSPATRDGAPVRARIRYAITFRAPPPPPPAEPTPPPPAEPAPRASPAPRPREPEAIDVLVLGERPPPSAKSMSRAEVRQLPGAFGDPFRAIEIMPGVTPIASGLPYFYVRGAPPGNVGYFLDGVRVPYLFHVAAGPSVVHPAIVERVDLYSGGYPARFGRFAGAVVAAETKEPQPEPHGEATLRLVDVGALVEAPFDDRRGKALVGGRYSYTAAIVSLVAPEITLDYRDYQARVSYDITPHDRLTLFAFGAYDLLAENKNGITTILFGSEFYRADLRYDVALPGQGKLRWATTVGFDQTRIADQRNARDVLGGARVELTLPVDDDATLRAGLDVTVDDYEADPAPYGDPEDPDVAAYNSLFPSRTDGAAGAWLDVVFRPDPRLEVTPGLRLDMYHSGTATAPAVEPRLSARLEVTPELRLLQAFGVAHQPPSFIVPIPGLAIGNLRDGLQTSLQLASGLEADLPWKTVGSLTLFQSIFLDMSDTAGLAPAGDDGNQVPRSLGTSHGVEVYLRRNLTSSLGGFVSYTLSEATRTIGGVTFPFAFDRTHVFHTALSYEIGAGFRAGARLTYYTGVPNLEAPSGLPETSRITDPPREPSFYRIDGRIEKKWTWGETTWLALVVEALNATLNKETLRGREIGPVTIPSIGLEGAF